jgi:CRP-like cAMP-binding protein
MADQGISRIEYAQDQVLFHEGDPGDAMFFVETGRVALWKVIEGERQILGVVERGQIFGEMVFLDDRPRMANATALDPTVVRRIPKTELTRRINDLDPFMRLFVRSLFDKVRSLGDLVDVLNRELAARQ